MELALKHVGLLMMVMAVEGVGRRRTDESKVDKGSNDDVLGACLGTLTHSPFFMPTAAAAYKVVLRKHPMFSGLHA